MKGSRDYSVGYCKPPEHGKFKPGKSGNPSGRKKKLVPGFTDQLRDELNSPITLRANGKRQTLSQLSVIVKQVVQGAMKGDIRFLKFLTETQAFQAAIENPNHRPFNGEEQKLLDEVRREARNYIIDTEEHPTND